METIVAYFSLRSQNLPGCVKKVTKCAAVIVSLLAKVRTRKLSDMTRVLTVTPQRSVTWCLKWRYV